MSHHGLLRALRVLLVGQEIDEQQPTSTFSQRTGRSIAAGHAIWLPPPPNSPTHHPATTSGVCHTAGQLSRWCRRRKRRAWRVGSRGRPKARASRPPLLLRSSCLNFRTHHLYRQTARPQSATPQPHVGNLDNIEALQSKLLPPQAAQEGKDEHDHSGMCSGAPRIVYGVLVCGHPPPINPMRHPMALVTAACLCLCMSCPVVSAALAFNRGT